MFCNCSQINPINYKNFVCKLLRIIMEMVLMRYFNHSHKKRKDSLERRAVLFIFLLELEISGVAIQRINENSEEC